MKNIILPNHVMTQIFMLQVCKSRWSYVCSFIMENKPFNTLIKAHKVKYGVNNDNDFN